MDIMTWYKVFHMLSEHIDDISLYIMHPYERDIRLALISEAQAKAAESQQGLS